jgi:serine/threonine protein kinase
VGKQTEQQAHLYGRQLLSAFEYLHEKNIVHRDLKAENLMLDDDKNLKIIDFGLSNDMTGKESLTTQCGSMAYSAPELLGSSQYGKEVDIWSIGVCLYVLMTGTLPFGNIDSLTDLHALVCDSQYELPGTMSAALKDMFAKMFQIKPRKRITIAQLWAHDWFVGIGDPEKPLVCTLRTLEAASVDRNIVSQMARMGFEREAAIMASLLHNNCDKSSATYHLMIFKAKKEAKQQRDAERWESQKPSSASTRGGKKGSAATGSGRRRSASTSEDVDGSRTGSALSPRRVSAGRGGKVAILPDEGGRARTSGSMRPIPRQGSGSGNRRRSSTVGEEGMPSRQSSGTVRGSSSTGALRRKNSTNSDDDLGLFDPINRQGSASSSGGRWANTHSSAEELHPARKPSANGGPPSRASSGTRIRRYSSNGSTASTASSRFDELESGSDRSANVTARPRRPTSTSPTTSFDARIINTAKGGRPKGQPPASGGRKLSSEEFDLDGDAFDDGIEFGFGDAFQSLTAESTSPTATDVYFSTLMAMCRVCEGGTIKEFDPAVISEKLCFWAHKALREAPDEGFVEALRRNGWNGIDFDDTMYRRQGLKDSLHGARVSLAVVYWMVRTDPTRVGLKPACVCYPRTQPSRVDPSLTAAAINPFATLQV